MPESRDQEWRRLTKLYADMFDGQLLELAGSLNDLTEMARTVLRDELRKRGLGDPLTAGWSAQERMQAQEEEALDAAEAEAGDKADEYTEYSWKVELCECDSREEALQRMEQLRRAGLESWLRSYRILVAADQLDEARAVIANPIPQDIIDESLAEIPEYDAPVCPACGTDDPILLSTEPSNTWECESCGKEWADPVDDRAEAS